MKRTLILLLFLSISNCALKSQDIYYKYKPAVTNGQRLNIYANDLLDVFQIDSTFKGTSINLAANYNYWKFNQKLLSAGYVNLSENYNSSKFYSQETFSSNHLSLNAFAGASYYPVPMKFYGTLAVNAGFLWTKNDTGNVNIGSVTDHLSTSYLFGALGYGRILNAGRINVAKEFEEKLIETKILKKPLKQETILALTKLLDEQSFDDYRYLKDDENPVIIKMIDNILQEYNEIDQPVDGMNYIRMYEILYNVYQRYVNYPRYTGGQVQVQAQYQIANDTKSKPHDHYLSLNGVYGIPFSYNTGILLSGYYAVPLDTLASEFSYGGSNTFLSFIPENTNLTFFQSPFTGYGVFSGEYTAGNSNRLGLRTDIFHTFSSKCGINGSVQISDIIPKNGNSIMLYDLSSSFQYNLINFLTSFVNLDYRKTILGGNAVNPKDTYFFSVGFNARVF